MTEVDRRLKAEIVALVQADDGWPAELAYPVKDIELDAVERELGVVLPRGYRLFLRWCGAGRVGAVDLFGLPRNYLWGDVVLMNQLTLSGHPPWYVKFARDHSRRDYYFDTAAMTPDGECPVVVPEPSGRRQVVAGSFLEFLGNVRHGMISMEPSSASPTR
jgi:SMI1-KNR4 cell-wall